ncbi:MAG: type III-B CRISPR module-associated protein Cmr5 [Gammaproteobacteria bacterium]|nr:type III-B CRISPR module-associated protein Cmr5 [Gammaproteobacteria bacterium]
MKPLMTLDQERSQRAWECVKNVPNEKIAGYTSVVKSSASLIMNNGLMQTLVYLAAKSNQKRNEYEYLQEHLCKWVNDVSFGGDSTKAQFPQAMESLYKCSSEQYMSSTREVVAFIGWLRQMADAQKSMAKSDEAKE